MGKVHPACAGQHPILSLLPLWVLALRVQAQGARKLRADRGFSPGPAISLAGFLVTLYGRIEVTPEVAAKHGVTKQRVIDLIRQGEQEGWIAAVNGPRGAKQLSLAEDHSEEGDVGL